MRIAFLCILLTGCAGFNVQGTVTATYNTSAITNATMNPGAVVPDPVKP